jgi:hypothetical protein
VGYPWNNIGFLEVVILYTSSSIHAATRRNPGRLLHQESYQPQQHMGHPCVVTSIEPKAVFCVAMNLENYTHEG